MGEMVLSAIDFLLWVLNFNDSSLRINHDDLHVPTDLDMNLATTSVYACGPCY